MAPTRGLKVRFHSQIWIRRKYRWWPGTERQGGLADKVIIAAIIAPGVIKWAAVLFGADVSSRGRGGACYC